MLICEATIRCFVRLLFSLPLFITLCLPVRGAVLLDEDWDDGDRTDTNLPQESAWFSSTVGQDTPIPTLSVSTGALTGHVRMFETNTSSRLWITHFAPTGMPVELGPGDTLKFTLTFVASNVTTIPATTRGFRIGLFNFSEPGAARVTADGFSTGAGAGAPGTNVTGYLVNMNFAQAFTISSPLQTMKRTDISNINLMGALGVFTSLGTGGGDSGTPAFSNGVPYTLEWTVRRGGDLVEIATKFSDTNGWAITNTVTDTGNPTFRFDGFAIRPNSAIDTAESFSFTRFKVETIPVTLGISSIRFTAPSSLVITWDSVPGLSYQLEARENLENGTWTSLGSVIATGNSASLDDSPTNSTHRFYRVVQF